MLALWLAQHTTPLCGCCAALLQHASNQYPITDTQALHLQEPTNHMHSQLPPPCTSTPQKEADALRPTKTSSASLIRAHGKGARQLLLTPGSVHFSGLAPGAVAHRTVRLRNVSAEVVRYHVQRPPQPFRVIYKPAPVAPGAC